LRVFIFPEINRVQLIHKPLPIFGAVGNETIALPAGTPVLARVRDILAYLWRESAQLLWCGNLVTIQQWCGIRNSQSRKNFSDEIAAGPQEKVD
jgi:hypothetical protein